MTNPTSNFGWQMPEPTDLVTNLPADFEVFGQAVDTDFVDLLGGTTGQVLSKTSNTDLDFTWTAGGDITEVAAGTGITITSGTGPITNVSFDYAVGNQAVANTQTDSYTLVLTDAGKIVVMNKATANTLTVPPNSSVAFGTNTRIDLLQYGAGQTSVAAGAGVTIYSSGSKLKLTGQYSGASLWKQGTNTWVLIGDIAT